MRVPRRAFEAMAIAGLVLTTNGCMAFTPRPIPSVRMVGGAVDDLDPKSLELAAERTAVAAAAEHRSFRIAGRTYSSDELAENARRVAAIARSETSAAALSERLARECVAYRSGEVAKVTGYYEPVLAARRVKDERFVYPVYRKPAAEELAAIERIHGRAPTREDIDQGRALSGYGLEIAWLDDPVAVFFLHIQGSGKLVFEDGSASHVGFAASNGLPYRSIGAVMREQGLLERGHTTAPEIRAWLAAHPEQRDAILFANSRYIYFQEKSTLGAVGASGVTLVPGRSIATDERYLPRGTFAWLRTTPVPSNEGADLAPAVSRFVFAHDTGAAIVGPARVDLFEGSGEEAGRIAGVRNDPGELFVVFCRTDV